MKKWTAACLSVVCLCVMCFGGCGNTENLMSKEDSGYGESESAYMTEGGDEKDYLSETTSSAAGLQEEGKADIEWETVTYSATDIDGYTYLITYKVSPFIFVNDTNQATIDAIWSEIGKDNTMPTQISDWGLKPQGNSIYRRDSVRFQYNSSFYSAYMTDMYYCFGTVSIGNNTKGWSITGNNQREVPISLLTRNIEDMNLITTITGYTGLGRMFFSSGEEDRGEGITASNAVLSSNSWGPMTFIIMMPENISPAYPNGQYSEAIKSNIKLYTSALLDTPDAILGSSRTFTVGVIDKDGTYWPPAALSR